MITGSRRELVFNDEFNTLSLNSGASQTETWRPTFYWGDRTLADNKEEQFYIDRSWNNLGLSAHKVKDGVLSLTATTTPSSLLNETGNLHYLSGMISSEQAFSQQYGYFEMRAQLPKGKGLWSAFWMLSIDAEWPPELDVFEVLGDNTDTIFSTVHTKETGSLKSERGVADIPTDMSAGFHTYAVDWRKDNITFFFDNKEIYKVRTPSDMHKPMYLLANLAVGGTWPGSPDASTNFPSSMKIDYIRAYQNPVDHEVFTSVPSSWMSIGEMKFGAVNGTGASTTYSYRTTMSDSQQNIKLLGEWARYINGNSLDNWIEGGTSQYQEYDGNGGNDVLKGGAGIDVFRVQNGDGNDTIIDFSNVNGNADKVYLEGFHFEHFADVKPFLKQIGSDVILQLDSDQALKFANITIDKLAPEQFAFFNSIAAPSGAGQNTVSPNPTPPPTSQDTITVKISGTGYKGDPNFALTLDGKTIDTTNLVTADYNAGERQTFTFTGVFDTNGTQAHKVGIQFTNNLSGTSGDRNLYVDEVTFNGGVSSRDVSITWNTTKYWEFIL
jgi:beta-glucanase (GH16 family)